MIHVYIHYLTRREARKVSRFLLNKRLVSCVSFIRQEDMYWWNGKLQETRGVVTFAAANKEDYKEIEQFVAQHHSYDVPCILELPINRVYKSYEQWLTKETSKKGRR